MWEFKVMRRRRDTNSWWTPEQHQACLSSGSWWTIDHDQLVHELVNGLRRTNCAIYLECLRDPEWPKDLIQDFLADKYRENVPKCHATTFPEYRAWLRTTLFRYALDKLRRDNHSRAKTRPAFVSFDELRPRYATEGENAEADSLQAVPPGPAVSCADQAGSEALRCPEATVKFIAEKNRHHPRLGNLVIRASLNDWTLKPDQLRRAAEHCFLCIDCFDMYAYLRCDRTARKNAVAHFRSGMSNRFTREELLTIAEISEDRARRLRYRSRLPELFFPYWLEAYAEVVRGVACYAQPGAPIVTERQLDEISAKALKWILDNAGRRVHA
jgi:hypothetical protein